MEVNSRERVLCALRREEPDRVPFLDPVIDEAVALPLLGKTAPEGLIKGELGTGDEPVFCDVLLSSDHYAPLDLVNRLDLDKKPPAMEVFRHEMDNFSPDEIKSALEQVG